MPNLESFLPIPAESHFSLHNLPYGAFTPPGETAVRIGVAAGSYVLDLSVLEQRGFFQQLWSSADRVFAQPTLNPFMAQGPAAWQAVRQTVQTLLLASTPTLRDDARLRDSALIPRQQASLHLPIAIGDYTDFYASKEHASNVGAMFRGREHALLPNWLHLPVGYHGRASSVVVSGTPIHRPQGQQLPPGSDAPIFAPTRELDFELELGAIVGVGNPLGQPISAAKAADHIFGMVLVNDWSARDIQRWEYRPLGPFLAKNFATSISPWVVPMAALAPFRTAGPPQEPPPLSYLQTSGEQAYDIQLAVTLQTAQSDVPAVISRTNARYLYWNFSQQLAHHTVTGCNVRPGDLLASGTISGSDPSSYGSLLELSWRGERPLQLPNGQQYTFLQDGDRLTLSGWCQGDGYRVGFGDVTGVIMPPYAS